MSYLRNLLGDGEEILFITRQHWFIPFAQVLFELIVIVILIASALFIPPVFNIQPMIVYLIAAGLGIIVLLSALSDILRWRSEEYIITDRRVIQMQGVFSKNVQDSSLEKINDVQLQQSWLGRIFNYGDIEILTGNEEGVNRMHAIDRPISFKRAMQDARARYDGYLDRGAVQRYDGPRDVRAVLEQLAALRDRGILSPAEFESKKRDLLSRI